MATKGLLRTYGALWSSDQSNVYMRHCPSDLLRFRFNAGLIPYCGWVSTSRIHFHTTSCLVALPMIWVSGVGRFPAVYSVTAHSAPLLSHCVSLIILGNYLGPGTTRDATGICNRSDSVKALRWCSFPNSTFGEGFGPLRDNITAWLVLANCFV